MGILRSLRDDGFPDEGSARRSLEIGRAYKVVGSFKLILVDEARQEIAFHPGNRFWVAGFDVDQDVAKLTTDFSTGSYRVSYRQLLASWINLE